MDTHQNTITQIQRRIKNITENKNTNSYQKSQTAKNLTVGIDTSLSKFAIVVFDGDCIIDNILIRTGKEGSAKEYKWVNYYSHPQLQINYIADRASTFLEQYLDNIKYIAIEGLSFASVGDATRNLAGVFHSFLYAMYLKGFDFSNVCIYTPTQIKSIAKKISGIETKGSLDKKQMISVAESLYPEFLSQFVKSATSEKAGLEDYSDAILARWTREYKLLEGL